jgi:hypothetical protein
MSDKHMKEVREALREQYGLPPLPDYKPAPDNGQRNRKTDAPNTGIDATLDERGSRYGKFTGHAEITQRLKDAMRASPKWSQLKPDQAEALEMVQHKIGRILNGDPDYHDSWHDIVGYAKLVADRLEGVQR